MLKSIVDFCRLVVGSLFIVSGLIKANDALGFMYKLEEYFEPGALNWTWLSDYALEMAVFILRGRNPAWRCHGAGGLAQIDRSAYGIDDGCFYLADLVHSELRSLRFENDHRCDGCFG